MEDPPQHAPEGYDCPFCRLVNCNLAPHSLNAEADVVLRTATITAFISPAWWARNPGHVLVVPNHHYENLYDIPASDLAAVHVAAQRIARAMKITYQCDGVSTRQHNEPAGNQDVWHYHLHVFPRYISDDLYLQNNNKHWTTPDERIPYANKLRNALASLSEAEVQKTFQS